MNHGHDDFAFEPVPGLPERLPPGERALWRGKPSPWPLARDALHVRKVALYFAFLLAIKVATSISGGEGPVAALVGAAWLAGLALAAVGLLALFGVLMARTTIYTITDARVVMRFGVALPITVNVPFSIIQSVAVRERGEGVADIAFTLSGPDRIAWLHWWPHVRAWRIAHPEPMLRSVADGAAVAATLRQALISTAGASATVPPAGVPARHAGIAMPAAA